MKTLGKRTLCLVLALLLCLSLLPSAFAASPNDGSGTCGDHLTWTVDAGGTLVISGTGAMYDYSYGNNAPWFNDSYLEIKSVRIESGVTHIGNEAFNVCGTLTSASIPSSVKSIGDKAFAWCNLLSDLKIPEGVESIGSSAFWNCHGLTSLVIPNSVKSLGEEVFLNCRNLTSVTLPEGLTEIPDSLFDNCVKLTDVTIPSGVKRIGEDAFAFCEVLPSLNIPQAVTEIGKCAFYDCKSIKSLTLPAGMTRIENGTFHGCSSLTEMTIPKGVTAIEDCAFYECSSLKSVTLPGYLTKLGVQTFESCSSLQEIVIPEGVTKLESSLFEDCGSLKSVTIPSSVTEMGNYVFKNCSSLSDVWYAGTKEQWEAIDFTVGNDPLFKATIHFGGAGVFEAPSVTGKLSSGKPKLTWKAVDGAAKYEIWRSTTGKTGSFKKLTTVTGTSYTNKKAGAGKTYYYKVKAVKADGTKSAFSKIVKLTAKPAAPSVTGKLASGKPKLTWKAVTGAEKYEIWRSTTGKSGSFKKLTTVTGTSWTNKKAGAGKTYYYKVKAVTADGTKSAFSSIVSLTARPKAPTVSGSLSAKGKPVLTWKAITGATKYEIWRSTSKNGTYKLIKTTTALKYTNSKAASEKTFYYKVKAVTADGTKSLYSSVVKLTVK